MNDIGKTMDLAKDLDMKLAADASKLSVIYDGHAIFKGTPEECYVYMQGWRDGREHYLRYESRGAHE